MPESTEGVSDAQKSLHLQDYFLLLFGWGGKTGINCFVLIGVAPCDAMLHIVAALAGQRVVAVRVAVGVNIVAKGSAQFVSGSLHNCPCFLPTGHSARRKCRFLFHPWQPASPGCPYRNQSAYPVSLCTKQRRRRCSRWMSPLAHPRRRFGMLRQLRCFWACFLSSVATVSSTSVLLSGVCKVLSVCCAQAQSNTVAKRMDNRHFFIL